jgi:hypothetical protein
MPVALTNIVDIELFIEGKREMLYQKIACPDLHSRVINDSRPSHMIKIANLKQSSEQKNDSPYSYDVQGTQLLEDGSGRIFKVEHLNSIHLYYAFIFEGYVILPAFLAAIFKLSDYACLDVSNGFHHYYIFLNAGIDDPLSDILGESSRFLGIHNFVTPPEGKALALNSRNKDIEYVIGLESPLFNVKAFRYELAAYQSATSELLQKLNVNENYYFVPKAAREKFKFNHSGIFTKKFDLGGVFIVHRESKSYKEILKLMGILN